MGKKIKDSLTAKAFLWIFGLLVVCSLLIYGIVMFFIPKSYIEMSRASAVDKVIRLADDISQMAEELPQTKFDDVGAVVDRFCWENRLTIALSNGTDTQIYGSQKGQDEKWEDNCFFSMSMAFSASNTTEDVYSLRLIAWASSEHELTSVFLKLLPLILALIVLISALGAFLCSKVLVKPILEISRASQRMANLDMTWDCKVERTDEIGVLANSLNTMSCKLDAALRDLESANAQLREDMEHIATLSKQRRDFFAAASHELKTPITILKGQIESMILGIGSFKDTRKVLPDTLKEVENMERLVKEILTISKIEMDGLMSRPETVLLSASLEKVAELLQPLAEEKQITLEKNIAAGITLQGNPAFLEKALHNILSNAIRHSPDRAQVSVMLHKDCLEVNNSGVSIPEEDIPSLFTPFYRVEKSRNKATGGSGLGLYLVKTILQLHRLPFSLENHEDGVCFTIQLNQN